MTLWLSNLCGKHSPGELGMLVQLVIPVLGRLRQEAHKLKASLSYIVCVCGGPQKKQTNKTKRITWGAY
jgi:hypothetical protein